MQYSHLYSQKDQQMEEGMTISLFWDMSRKEEWSLWAEFSSPLLLAQPFAPMQSGYKVYPDQTGSVLYSLCIVVNDLRKMQGSAELGAISAILLPLPVISSGIELGSTYFRDTQCA